MVQHLADTGAAETPSPDGPRGRRGAWLRSPLVVGAMAGIALLLAGHAVLEHSTIADRLVAPLLVADTPSSSADVIVVAGAGVVGPCMPNLSAVRRSVLAVDLWKAGRAAYVVFTGGDEESECGPALAMANFAERLGVPHNRVRMERTSRSTRENAFYARPVLEGLHARHIILVTDQLHMRRASAAFSAMGYRVERAAVPVYATHHGNVDMLAGGLREYAALAYYRLRGWLSSPVEAAGPVPSTKSRAGGPEVQQDAQRAAGTSVVILGASYAAGWNPASLGGLDVVNKGVAGQQSFEMAERFDADVVAAGPRAVVIWGFINDIFRAPADGIEEALARMQKSYTEMVAAGRAAGLDVIIATEVTVTTEDTWTDRIMSVVGGWLGKQSYQERVNEHVRAGNAWLRDFARREGLMLLDIETVLARPDGWRRREFAQPDGSHLTEEAYRAITDYAAPILQARFARP